MLLAGLGLSLLFPAALSTPALTPEQRIAHEALQVMCPSGCGTVRFIRTPGVDLAYAQPSGVRTTIITYNPNFLARASANFGADAVFGVFAHEIGHHIDFHFSRPGWMNNSWTRELSADAWAGCALAASGKGTDSIVKLLRLISGHGYPSAKDRRHAIETAHKACSNAAPPLSPKPPPELEDEVATIALTPSVKATKQGRPDRSDGLDTYDSSVMFGGQPCHANRDQDDGSWSLTCTWRGDDGPDLEELTDAVEAERGWQADGDSVVTATTDSIRLRNTETGQRMKISIRLMRNGSEKFRVRLSEATRPDLPEAPSQAELRAALKKVKPAALACPNEPGTEIRVKLSVNGETGLVTSANGGGDNCVARAFFKARFPKFKKRQLGVTYTLRFP